MNDFNSFITQYSGEISLIGLSINIISCALLCSILAWVYVKYGTTISNRITLAKTFVLVGVTTTLIITIVKSSLALSLGLVGALSIVRFRAAIKEPEELGYLFLTIAIGLGFGADQWRVTLLSFLLILTLILIYRKFNYSGFEQNSLYFKINKGNSEKVDVKKLITDLSKFCSTISIRRFEERSHEFDITFNIVVDSFENFLNIRNEIKNNYPDLDIVLAEDIRLS
jgi:hypothetical protein